MHEIQTTPLNKASFLTLTVDDEHLAENGNLDKRAWVLFAKKLRNQIGPFRFLMCGEYGSRTHTERSHYHAIIFGHDFTEDRVPLEKNEQGQQLYTSEALTEIWDNGISSIGGASFDSASYVASYIQKRVNGKKQLAHYTRKTVDPNAVNKLTGEIGTYSQVPEFALMSRGDRSKDPITGYGLGHGWISKYYREVYPRDEVLVNGVLAKPPAYYDRWLEKHHPALMAEVKTKRKLKNKEYIEDNSPARLATKKKCFTAKAKRY